VGAFAPIASGKEPRGKGEPFWKRGRAGKRGSKRKPERSTVGSQRVAKEREKGRKKREDRDTRETP